jgi:hypothetical protein
MSRTPSARTVAVRDQPLAIMRGAEPAQSFCPATDLLGEGLRWLHDTAQPATAIIDCRGATAVLASANRLIRWVPLGWAWKASIVIDVAHVDWGPGMGPPLNPLCSGEILRLAIELHHLGADIADIRCATTGVSGTVALQRPAHPTLRAAVRRFMQGCPIHHSRICGRPESRGARNCTWCSDGQRGVIWPFRHRELAQPDHRPTGIEVPQR